MRVLVLGAYGLIGQEIVRELGRAGFAVTGFGRSARTGRRLLPNLEWRVGDLARMTRPEDWSTTLAGVDAVVNASGALQDGLKDDLARAQGDAISALITAAGRASIKRYVQISAPGATADARTQFLRTKAAADGVLRRSTLDWTILKPGLVVGAGAYGGTALVRMLAAFPVVQPIVLADARIQTVAASDVAAAVRLVLQGQVASRSDYDLMEAEAHTLEELVCAVRRWAGRDRARSNWRLPRWAGHAVAKLADIAGWMGWRSPLRTTALRSLEHGVTGDSNAWAQAGGFQLKALDQTLAVLPATMQERVFGRAQLVYPVLLISLSVFWLASGIIGAVRIDAAASLIAGRIGDEAARWLAGLGALADILIGAGLLFRKSVRTAALGSIALSIGYLAAGTWLTPGLWADPLGPFVKVLPAIALALAVAALTEER